MFDISWSEFLIVGVVALIAIGPKELPTVLRALGHWIGKVRRMASDFQDQFREAMREADVADLKRQFDEASAKATSAFNNPLTTAQKEVEAAFGTETPASPSTGSSPESTAVSTADPGAIEPSANAPALEPLPPIVPVPAVTATEVPAELTVDAPKQSGGGAA